ncbi:uncharacterized protein BO87DRAFT_124380 [Aspergillus neoniger CBS 115656]|uniref:Uncharacterized protein n=1 Tax=Aspergillus neoniger (strain CBS 115656) TaxID=1448310 RepID=A0A318YCQ8_ASPNB|nr:hypothetical protein BO87DRAFT_124380 [Aspergillus neoniger CBS 115656]PYH31357.1 hypothetical protein BO87DRAFT_124380 [Aspergillus neoniger CBS 115656]
MVHILMDIPKFGTQSVKFSINMTFSTIFHPLTISNAFYIFVVVLPSFDSGSIQHYFNMSASAHHWIKARIHHSSIVYTKPCPQDSRP